MGLLDGKKTKSGGSTAEVVEYDRQMAALEQKKKDVIASVGQIYVDNNDSKSAAGTAYEELLKEIERIREEVVVLEKKKLAVQGLRKCEKCGNILVLDSVFCNKCGEKLAKLFVPTEQNPYICEKCGTPYSEGALFCTGCGSKLE